MERYWSWKSNCTRFDWSQVHRPRTRELNSRAAPPSSAPRRPSAASSRRTSCWTSAFALCQAWVSCSSVIWGNGNPCEQTVRIQSQGCTTWLLDCTMLILNRICTWHYIHTTSDIQSITYYFPRKISRNWEIIFWKNWRQKIHSGWKARICNLFEFHRVGSEIGQFKKVMLII